MKLYYDFHIHTALSPCGSSDNTPNNIVRLAKMMELDAIAITDHNSSLNCKACMEVGLREGIIVIAGMEITTSEDIHCVCIFKTLEKCMEFYEFVKANRVAYKNNVKIFGKQEVLDFEDKLLYEEADFLLSASEVSIADLKQIVDSYDGFCFPSHVDRSGSGIMPTLGEIPSDFGFNAIELFKLTDISYAKEKGLASRFAILRNSDCHFLEELSERKHFIEVEEMTIDGIFDALRKL